MIIPEKFWHKLFEASIIIKALNGAWETITGLALLFLTKPFIANVVFAAGKKEVVDSPQDHAIMFLTNHLQNIPEGTRDFVGLYILAHGLINIFLAYYLYKEKMWSYSVSIAFFSISVVYLGYRAIEHPSILMFALIIFDIFFTALTWHEYKYRLNQIKLQTTAQ